MNPRGRDQTSAIELSTLVRRLSAAQRRLADAAPYGPEWDAARASIEDLSGRIRALHYLDEVAETGVIG